jgi:hypothetical protein
VTRPELHKSEKHVGVINWEGMEGSDSTASLENLPNPFCKNPRNTEEYVGDF